MDKKKLKIARKKIDKIDDNIFKLIVSRTKIVKQMMSFKQYKNQIVDYKRINTILKKIKKKSIYNKIDPKITFNIWKSMIWSYVNFQKKNFKKK